MDKKKSNEIKSKFSPVQESVICSKLYTLVRIRTVKMRHIVRQLGVINGSKMNEVQSSAQQYKNAARQLRSTKPSPAYPPSIC